MSEVRPPLTRHTRGRVLFGVCAGLAEHLRMSVTAVRVLMLIMAFCAGAGLILYLWLWALLPLEESPGTSPDARTPSGTEAPVTRTRRTGVPGMQPTGAQPPGAQVPPSQAAEDVFMRVAVNVRGSYRRNPSLWFGFVIGVMLLLLSGGLVASSLGVRVPWGAIIPIVLLIAGVVLVWVNLNDTERKKWRGRTGTPTTPAVIRLVGGLALLVLGIVFVVLTATNGTPILSTMLAVFAVLVGIALVLVPFAVRFSRNYLAERADAARTSERADIAAHLHDSVLQTLTLIRRRHDDPVEVARLARGQERELREWLYGSKLEPGVSLADAVKNMAGEIEDLYGVEIDTVIVGDVRSDRAETPDAGPSGESENSAGPAARLGALQAAAREAMVNAAVHAGGTVSVYAEFSADAQQIFVRDRGDGFDVDDIDESRHGVRHSIIGRMERHGGSAEIVHGSGGGTEVRLTMTNSEGTKA